MRFSSLTRRSAILAALVLAGCASPSKKSALTLFNGENLAGWRKPTGAWEAAGDTRMDATDPKKFIVFPGTGTMVNGATGRTSNLLSEYEHGDVAAHIEFMVPKNSNSGIYFQGRYEVQVFDSWGVEHPKFSDCGGIYERSKNGQGFEGTAPKSNASKPPGEWQTFDVVFRAPRFDPQRRKTQNARFVSVRLNGKLIHENVDVTGPTRSATFESTEEPLGPLMFQGDHGPVAYRNLSLTPLTLD
jgi:hypothetical protein